MFFHYIKIAFRHILEEKMQNIISVIGIALGIFCFCLTLYYIRLFNNEYSGFPHYVDLAQLRIAEQGSSYEENMIPEKLVRTLENNPVTGIEKIATYTSWNDANITFSKNKTETVPFLCRVSLVNLNFFDVFSCQLVTGIISLQSGEAIISEACARKVFGKQNAIGRHLYFTPAGGDMQKASFNKIVGVVRDMDPASSLRSDVYLPSALKSTEAMILLTSGSSEGEINKRLEQMNLLPEQPQKTVKVARISSTPLAAEQWVVQTVILFIASLVLIGGLSNFLKNCIYTFYNRTQEMSLRKELGAGRLSLLNMLFSEIVIVLLGAGVISMCISELIVPNLYRFVPSEMDALLTVNLPVLLRQQMWIIIVLCIVCALLAWWAVIRMEKISVIRGLRSYGGVRKNKHGIRNFMVGFQIFICTLFIGGTLGLHYIYLNIEKDRYFPLSPEELKRIWTFYLSEPQLQGRQDEILSQINQLSGVKEVLRASYHYTLPYESSQGYRIYGTVIAAGANYFSFYNIPVQGRMPDNEQTIVVVHPFWETLLADTALTKAVLGDKTYQVSGHYKREPFTVERERSYTAVTFSEHGNHFYVKSVAGQEEEVKKQIDRIIRRYLPATIPFRIVSQDELNGMSKGQFDLFRNLFAILSVITIMITVMGIYATITVDSLSRQKEVAIRKVNGANMKDIIYLFGKLYLRLWGMAYLIAFLILLLITQTISGNFRNYISHFNSLWFWFVVLILVAFLVFGTVAYRIKKISKLNPVMMLRKD